MLACWLRHFVNEFNDSPHNRTLSHIDMDDILEGCLRKPNYYTKSVLLAISTIDPELGQDLKKFIRYIDQMMLKSISDKKKINSNQHIPTQDEDKLLDELKELETQLVNMKSSSTATPITQQHVAKKEKTVKQDDDDMMDIDEEESAWSLYQDWKPCPMGTIPNGKVPCLDMSILLKSK